MVYQIRLDVVGLGCVCVWEREFGRSKWRLAEHESVMESTEKLEYKLVEKSLI